MIEALKYSAFEKNVLPFKTYGGIAFCLVFILGLFTWTAKADTWTGAAEVGSPRSWGVAGGWQNGIVPPPASIPSI
jgi:hypothetical protein